MGASTDVLYRYSHCHCGPGLLAPSHVPVFKSSVYVGEQVSTGKLKIFGNKGRIRPEYWTPVGCINVSRPALIPCR